MKRVQSALRAALGLWILLAAAVPPARAADPGAARTPLAAALDRALAAPALRGAELAALVVDAADGAPLYARHPDRALVPASNLKVLTALAALARFGPAHRFTTRVHADALPDAEGAVETLYVLGGGDPGLTSEDLWRLASDLRLAGLRRVRGDLVYDDSLFDGERWHPSWLPLTARAYHAPVGALNVNYGAFSVSVSAAAAPGEAVRVSVDPPIPFLRVVNRGRTSARNSRAGGVVDRRAAERGEEVLVAGSWPVGEQRSYYRGVLDPAAYTASLLVFQLEALGIEVVGSTRRAYLPAAAPELLAFEGRPLADAVGRFLKFSSNASGEALVKALGAADGPPGSWSGGIAAVRRELEALGLSTEGLVMVDGSGLSRSDRATPRLLVEALRAGRRSFAFGPELVAGLPIGGTDGTLARRASAAGAQLRAKTGLLSGVTGLTGFAERADGSVVAFSVLANGFRDAGAAMDALDAFAAALVAPR